jgi:hypothetical protein
MKFAGLLFCAAVLAVTGKATPFCVPNSTTWCEVTDAGPLPSNAQATIGTGTLDDIIGKIGDGTGGADMYSIYIPDPSDFSANWTGYGSSPLTPAALYLFDLNGNGIEAADDGSPALGGFAGAPGFYFIDIAPDGNDPQYHTSGGNDPIFTFSGGLTFPNGGAGPITSYSKGGCGVDCEGGYDINLSGAQFSNLPEPGSMLLTGAAMMGLAGLLKRRRA